MWSMIVTRYQVLRQRYMSTYGAKSRYRMVWTWCDRREYDAYRRQQLTSGHARRVLIEPGKKTLVVP